MYEYLMHSPIGFLHLKAQEEALVELNFLEKGEPQESSQLRSGIISLAVRQLHEYFDGKRTAFELPLIPEGTDFQKEVWSIVSDIPYGSTSTYSEISKKIGDPKKVRAVGRANGQNPIPIIIPCHRVVGSNNELTGYSGGIERKKRLLQHEGVLLL